MPVNFDIDGAGSSVSISGTWIGSIARALCGNLENRIFSLGGGETYAFDFFTLTVAPAAWGFGGGIASEKATLAFEAPVGAGSVTGNGDGWWWFTIFVILSSGALIWDGSLPQTVLLAGGDSFTVDYSDICEVKRIRLN